MLDIREIRNEKSLPRLERFMLLYTLSSRFEDLPRLHSANGIFSRYILGACHLVELIAQ